MKHRQLKTTDMPSSRWDYDARLLALLAMGAAVFSFLYYFRTGDVLLYGDAVAHINIARRVFDSRTPGLLQLGTVWLPLPHLLIVPFVISDSLWQSGAGGSIPSLVAYVLSVIGVFRLTRGAMGPSHPAGPTRGGAWCAALIYGANPNLIYMQSTAMSETVYLAFFVWAVVHFIEFAQETNADKQSRSLTKCGLCLLGACLTRYDGWFLAAVMVVVAIVVLVRRRTESGKFVGRRALVNFVLLAACGPVLWLGYNAAVYRNPLEFARGPYSAQAIEKKTGTVNPAKGNVLAAGSYFLKAGELNVGEAPWQGRVWLAIAFAGTVLLALRGGRLALLLWVPLPFYAFSIAYGSVPIFVPSWWPFTRYNVRYGLELLPAFAVFAGTALVIAVDQIGKARGAPSPRRTWAAAAAVVAIAVLAGWSYVAIWRAAPICLQEAEINSRTRNALEKRLADLLVRIPPSSTLLMYLGDHVGALEQADIPLRRVINEGNHRVWKQPRDPQGLWERALADPVASADYIVAFEGDPVWDAMQSRHATELIELHTSGQPRAVIYQGRPR